MILNVKIKNWQLNGSINFQNKYFWSVFSNNFRALKYIARGEFAQVWEMERLREGKKFAVKIIDKEVSFGSVKGKEAVYNEI